MLSQGVVKIAGELAHLESLMAPGFKNICAPFPPTDDKSEAGTDFPAWVLLRVPAPTLRPGGISLSAQTPPTALAPWFWGWRLQGQGRAEVILLESSSSSSPSPSRRPCPAGGCSFFPKLKLLGAQQSCSHPGRYFISLLPCAICKNFTPSTKFSD